MHPALERFTPATREWFSGAFPEPTPAQAGAWAAIGAGKHALVVAPTGSGKTLSAFLWSIDRLLTEPPPKFAHHRRPPASSINPSGPTPPSVWTKT